MKQLNLANPSCSDIMFEISKFPDGQQQVTLLLNPVDLERASEWGTSNKAKFSKVVIKSRLNNFSDLELIACAVASLKELGIKEVHLYVPYIMGARSDRKFVEGSNNYLKDIICPILNSFKLKSITCIDPHSDCLEMGLHNFRKETNKTLVQYALRNLYGYTHGAYQGILNNKFVLVAPDAGAAKKIYKLAESINYKGDIIICSKDRDAKGKLTKTVIPHHLIEPNVDYIIVDDICDGGATFINIAKEIKNNHSLTGKLYLIITHGIFSKGFAELNQHFDGIYCTNSYKNVEETEYHALENTKTNTKQLNVFLSDN